MLFCHQENFCDSSLAMIKQRLSDISKQEADSLLHSSVKCSNYQYMVDNLCLQYYLVKGITNLYKTCITKIRLCSHNLFVESGRFFGIPRHMRICSLCKIELEDELHFVLKCKVFHGFRVNLIKPYYWRKPSMYKFIQLMSSNNVKELCNLGKYIYIEPVN